MLVRESGRKSKLLAAEVQSQHLNVGSHIAIFTHTCDHLYSHGASDRSKGCCNWSLLPFLLLVINLIEILVFLIIIEKLFFFFFIIAAPNVNMMFFI